MPAGNQARPLPTRSSISRNLPPSSSRSLGLGRRGQAPFASCACASGPPKRGVLEGPPPTPVGANLRKQLAHTARVITGHERAAPGRRCMQSSKRCPAAGTHPKTPLPHPSNAAVVQPQSRRVASRPTPLAHHVYAPWRPSLPQLCAHARVVQARGGEIHRAFGRSGAPACVAVRKVGKEGGRWGDAWSRSGLGGG